MVVFYKIWKKYDEIQLTKENWAWTLEKIKKNILPRYQKSKSTPLPECRHFPFTVDNNHVTKIIPFMAADQLYQLIPIFH